jgi:hypothetical protein
MTGRLYSYSANQYEDAQSIYWAGSSTGVITTEYLQLDQLCSWAELPGGKLAFTGGKHGYPDARFLVVDVNRDFAAVAKSRMINSRRKHGSVYFEGFLYVIGGYNGISMKDCERFDFQTEKWQQIEDLPIYLKGMAVVVVESLRSLYAVGGDAYDYDLHDDLQACIFQYHFDELTWITLPVVLPSPDAYFIACFADPDTPQTLFFVQSSTLYSLDLVSMGMRDCRVVKVLPQQMWAYYGPSLYQDGVLYCSNSRGACHSLALRWK